MLTILALAFADPLPTGTPLPEAAAVHISAAGFDHLAELVEGMVPDVIPMDPLVLPFACDEADPAPLELSLNGLNLYVVYKRVRFTPRDGALGVDLSLTLAASAPEVRVTGGCTALLPSIDQTCVLSIPQVPPDASSGPTPAVTADLHLDLAFGLGPDGTPVASASGLDVTLGHLGNPLVPGPDGCLLGDLFDTLLALSPTLLDSQVAPLLTDAIGGLEGDLSSSLTDALAAARFDTDVPLTGAAALSLSLAPTAIRVDSDGLFLGMGATIVVQPDTSRCAPAGTGSRRTGTGWPTSGTGFAPGTPPYELGLFLNRDLTDHLLYAVWESGALCQDIGTLANLPIGTSFLGPLYGEAFAAWFPEDTDATWTLLADAPPTTRLGATPTLAVEADALALEVAAELDGRLARFARSQIGLRAEVGLSVAAGAVTPSLTLPEDRFLVRDAGSEYLPAGFSDGVGRTLPGLISGFLPADLLPTLPVSLAGATLASLTWVPDAEADAQWVGGFAALDTSAVAPIDVSNCGGCSEDGTMAFDVGSAIGCDDPAAGCGGEAGCEGGGCALRGPAPSRWLPLIAAATIAWRRRRSNR